MITGNNKGSRKLYCFPMFVDGTSESFTQFLENPTYGPSYFIRNSISSPKILIESMGRSWYDRALFFSTFCSKNPPLWDPASMYYDDTLRNRTRTAP